MNTIAGLKHKDDKKFHPYNPNKNGAIYVDLDGTLAEYFGHLDGDQSIGAPIPRILELVKTALSQGRTVKIFTARLARFYNMQMSGPLMGEYCELMDNWATWCATYGLPVLEMTCIKGIDMSEIWDDRAHGVVHNTGQFKVEAARDLTMKWVSEICKATTEKLHEQAQKLFKGGKTLVEVFAEEDARKKQAEEAPGCQGSECRAFRESPELIGDDARTLKANKEPGRVPAPITSDWPGYFC